jgi:hypothetical protein
MKLIECINKKIMKENLICKITSTNDFVILKNSKPILFLALEKQLDKLKFLYHEKKSLEYKQLYPGLIYEIITQSRLNNHLLKNSKNIDRFLFISSKKSKNEICDEIQKEIKSIF